ncbi:GNAT family N-acetyltransferase [Shewanella gelidii]|uniref:GNAT family acetyltransferase n=1 Tax=Shewanella gelidii TaxID=1642821 RepID=A0A917NEQ3_9GAMM|nr:GNAT family N-acetyltransferase [Shewanella gelidii]MCL1098120.1 GNAT family N-acetyltransferase [Shewanella gelidii]GGI90662.1 GNAT family acetyltransferase [Shewanella gelidii]
MIKNSERLQFCLMNPNDADLLYELDQDVEVMRYINGGNKTTKQQLDEVYLPRLMSYTTPEKGWGMWKVETIGTASCPREFLGFILIRPLHFFSGQFDDSNLEIGWRFKRQYWGKGYAFEAAQSVIKGLVSSQPIQYFTAIADPRNNASVALMKKLNMTYLKSAVYRDPLGDSDAVFYHLAVND